MKIKFYRCSICEKIIAMVIETNIDTVCCGKPIEEIVPNTIDAVKEMHVPVYEIKDNKVFVTVSSVDHPMNDKHYIEWIAVETSSWNQRKVLKPGDTSKACFSLCEGDKVTTVYAYCNLHGLWKA